MHPNLVLKYNSRNGDDVAGLGWKLEGLPYIVRNKKCEINYENTDSFVNNTGNKLISKNDNEFYFMRDDYSKVEPIGSFSGAPDYWVENKPDGTKIYYGSNTDSKSFTNSLVADGIYTPTFKIRKWSVSKVEDLNGNSYKVKYFSRKGEIYPKYIIYTLNSTITKYNVISFEYDFARGDHCVNYVYSTPIDLDARLKAITVYTDVTSLSFLNDLDSEELSEISGKQIRKYVLNYIFSAITYPDAGPHLAVWPHPSILKSITIQGENSDNIIDTLTFDWEGLDFSISDKIVAFPGYTVNPCDVNGDGLTDFINGTSIYYLVGSSFSSLGSISNSSDLGKTAVFSPCDLNGDGAIDLLSCQKFGKLMKARFFIANGYNIKYDSSLNIDIKNTDASNCAILDCDGDGLNEIILNKSAYRFGTAFKSSSTFNLFASYPFSNVFQILDVKNNGKQEITNATSFSRRYVEESKTFVESDLDASDKYLSSNDFDFNGDGRADDLSVIFSPFTIHSMGTSYTLEVSKANLEIKVVIKGGTEEQVISQEFSPLYNFNTGYTIKKRTFEGEGGGAKSIAILPDSATSVLNLNNRYSFSRPKVESKFVSCDVNNDGLSDLIVYFTPDASSLKMYYNIYLSDGKQFYYYATSENPVYGSSRCVVDIDGDGKNDVANLQDKIIQSFDSTPCLLKSVKTMVGGKILIEYASVHDFQYAIGEKPIAIMDAPVKSKNTDYPYVKNTSPRMLVSKITVNDGVKNLYSNSYDYVNGRKYTGEYSDSKETGFEQIICTNSVTKDYSITYYLNRELRTAGVISRIENYSNNELIKMVDYSYSVNNSFTSTEKNSPFHVMLNKINERSFENQIQASLVETYLTYDDYGRNTSETISSEGNTTFKTKITYYPVDQLNWIFNQVQQVEEFKNNDLISCTGYVYDNNMVKLVSYYDINAGVNNTYSFEYDESGNVIEVKDPNGVSIKYQYDEYAANIVGIENALGQKQKMQYNTGYGSVLNLTDLNGNTSRNEFDQKGRVVKLFNVDNKLVREIDYHDSLLGDLEKQHYTVKEYDESKLGYTYVDNYFDGLGRVYKTISKAFSYDGTDYTYETNVEFDDVGRVVSSTSDHLSGGDSYTTSVSSRDYRGRPTKIVQQTAEGDRDFSIDYSGSGGKFIQTTTDAKNIKTQCVYDSYMRLIKKIEALGTSDQSVIEYQYDQPGNKFSVIVNDAVTTETYDSLGRLVQLNDPNVGVKKYQYYNNNLCKSITDAKGNSVTYQYDNLNRLIKENSADDEITYFYDGSDNSSSDFCLGNLTKVTDKNSITTYQYDNKGNVINYKQKIDSFEFNFSFTYDLLSRMKDITYPDGNSITYNYSEAGYVEAVTQKGTTKAYVRYGNDPAALASNGINESCNPYDYLAMKRTGNGILTKIKYEAVTHNPQEVETVNVNEDSTLNGFVYERLNATFDKNNNLTNINYTDYMNQADTSQSIEYQYDSLNRLISSKTMGVSETFKYDANGNMVQKAGALLSYDDPTHPHAVTSFVKDGVTKNYSYDANGNMINHNGKTLSYDAKGKMISMSESGKNPHQFYYDYTGSRVKRIREDGTVFYNVLGLYDVAVLPNSDSYHTRYILGMQNEIVSQITQKNISLVSNESAFNRFITASNTVDIVNSVLLSLDHVYHNPGNYLFIVLTALGLGIMSISYVVIARTGKKYLTFNKALAPIVIVMFIPFSGVLACSSMTGDYTDIIGNDNTPDDPSSYDLTGIPKLGTYYFHKNNVENIYFITDSVGNVAYRTRYKPYGEEEKESTTGEVVTRFGFTSQENDNTGLMYYGARYYDPEIGRFIQADTIIPDPTSAMSFNRYMYCLGNPIIFNDPTGHSTTGSSDRHADHAHISSSDKSGGGMHGEGNKSAVTATVDQSYVNTTKVLDVAYNGMMSKKWRSLNNETGSGNSSSMNTEGSSVSENAGTVNASEAESPAKPKTNEGKNGDGGIQDNKESSSNVQPTQFKVSSLFPDNTNFEVTSRYGMRKGADGKKSFHHGWDVWAKKGTRLNSLTGGIASIEEDHPEYGNYVIITIDNMTFLYAHMDTISVKNGQTIKAGDKIGTVGKTGKVFGITGVHVHLKVTMDGKEINPATIFGE